MIKTEIKELDSLLGNEEIKEGSIIIIKGGPGSGKTTLGLQILNNNLAKQRKSAYKDKDSDKLQAVFLSLEVPHKSAIEHVKSSYNFHELDSDKSLLIPFLKEEFKNYLTKRISEFKETGYDDIISKVFSDYFAEHNINQDLKKCIIFIDSLNLFIDIILQTLKEETNLRNIIHQICDVATKGINNSIKPVFIFSVEYHQSIFENKIYISESFMCDIEIMLNIEPIKETSLKQKSFITGVGYEIEVDKEGKKAYEYRSFCRVLKSRYSKNDSRRCSYDLKTGKGVVFYETFPGDGQINLFYENDRQYQVWQDFFKDDIPHLYPALRYEVFNRKNLQQTFSNQRRAKYIPEKTDLYLTSLDNYWVHWYVDLWRKTNIWEIIENNPVFSEYNLLMHKNKDYNILNLVINRIHATLTRHKLNIDEFKSSKSLSDNILISKETPYFNLYKQSENLSTNELDNPDQNILRIEPSVTCIKNVKNIIYIDNNGYKLIKINGDMHIIGNTKGMIIQCTRMINDIPNIKTIITNHSHLEFNVNQNIEKSGKARTIEDSNSQDLIFDLINGVTFKKKQNSTVNMGSPVKNGHILELPDEVAQFAIIDGKIWYENTSEFNETVRKIIEEMIDEKFEQAKLAQMTKLSTNKYLKCIRCNYLRLLQSNFYENNGTFPEENIAKLFKTLNSENITNELLLEHLKAGLKKIDKSTYEKEDVAEQVFLTLMYELAEAKWFSCKYSDENKDKLIEHLTSNSPINKLKATFTTQHKCKWEKLFTTKDKDKNPFKTIEDEVADIKKEIEKNLFSLNVKNSTLVDYILEILNLENEEIKTICNKYISSDEYDSLKDEISRKIDKNSVIILILELLTHDHQKSVFVPLNKNDIRLFGEKRSEIIKELRNYNFESNMPIFHHDFIFSLRNYEKYISVPYDANISFIAYNKTALIDFYNALRKKGRGELKSKYIELVTDIYNNKKAILNKNNNENIKDNEKIINLIDRSILFNYPSTWEEIFAMLIMKKNPGFKNEFTSHTDKNSFLIESQNYNTFLITFLEILWNSGGDISTNPDYSLNNQDKLKSDMLHALYLIGYAYYLGLIPENSTIDISLQPASEINNKEWLFARHWYSTLIDLLTAKKITENQPEGKYLWSDTRKDEIDIMPMPVTLEQFLVADNPMEVKHYSCWGDWHFAITRGSENIAMGVELINKLMSSRNIADRAVKCANIPTTEEFYNLYGKNRCIDIPNRKDNNRLPDLTYNQLRSMLFKNAKSRSQIFDFRHYMREIHAVLKYTEYISVRDKVDNGNYTVFYPEYLLSDIEHKLDYAFEEINKFKEKDFQMY